MRFLAAALVLSTFARAATFGADVQISVDWQRRTGLDATPLHFGLNVFQGFDPAIAGTPGDPAYRRNVAYMRPGMIRYHHAFQARASTESAGWILDPQTEHYRWDEAKIRAALAGAYPFNPVVMMSVVSWPAFLDDGAGKLKPEHYDAFAAFCADLVRIIHRDLGYRFPYWEVTNEKDGVYFGDCRELGEIYVRAARAMRAVDPTIKVGGPAFGSPEKGVNFEEFVAVAHAELDFISYHQYPSSSLNDSDAKIWDLAQSLGTITTNVQRKLREFTDRPIETFHNEYNINYRWRSAAVIDPRMTTIKGAVFDALAMFSMIEAGVTGIAAWNEGDAVFGKLDDPMDGSGKRPAAHLYHIFNTWMTGAVVHSSSTDPKRVASFAVESDRVSSVALVNRAGQPCSVRLTFAPQNKKTRATLRLVSAEGLAETELLPAIAAGDTPLELPEDAIAVVTFEGSAH
jgi:Alpha-L-arabinofuranosidase